MPYDHRQEHGQTERPEAIDRRRELGKGRDAESRGWGLGEAVVMLAILLFIGFSLHYCAR